MKAKLILLLALVFILCENSLIGQCTNCPSSTNVPTSSVLGYGSHASGMYSFASGYTSYAIGIHSVAIGRAVKSTAEGSFVIGAGDSDSYFLINNRPRTLMVGFTSKYPTLFVDESPESEFNDKTGRIAIGKVLNTEGYMDPQAKLHIRSDDDELATVFIEPNNWAGGEKAMLALGNLSYGISSDASTGFIFKSSNDYRFLNGKVGIGAFNSIGPEAKLHIKCNWDETADIFLEPYTDENVGEGGSWQANLYLGTREHGIMAQSNLGLVFNSSEDFLFNGGIVKMNGLQLNTGPTTQTGNILVCMGPEGDAVWQDPSEMISGLWTENDNNDIYRLSNVGIGTENPHTTLELSKNIETSGNVGLGINSENNSSWFLGVNGDLFNNRDLVIGENEDLLIQKPSMIFKTDGSIGIGTTETHGCKLAVDGEILAEEVMIQLSEDWPDYVFDPSYKLMNLGQLNTFIKENSHLPGIPTKQDVAENGVAVGEMEALLLKKVEELTLYIIAQQEQLETLTSEVERLKQQ